MFCPEKEEERDYTLTSNAVREVMVPIVQEMFDILRGASRSKWYVTCIDNTFCQSIFYISFGNLQILENRVFEEIFGGLMEYIKNYSVISSTLHDEIPTATLLTGKTSSSTFHWLLHKLFWHSNDAIFLCLFRCEHARSYIFVFNAITKNYWRCFPSCYHTLVTRLPLSEGCCWTNVLSTHACAPQRWSGWFS